MKIEIDDPSRPKIHDLLDEHLQSMHALSPPKHGEVKSMRTPIALRRRGAGRAILAHIVEIASHCVCAR